jgi:hypothetical protein
VVSFTPRPLYPQGKSPRNPYDRRLGWLQSRSGWYGEVKILDPTGTRTVFPRSSIPVCPCTRSNRSYITLNGSPVYSSFTFYPYTICVYKWLFIAQPVSRAVVLTSEVKRASMRSPAPTVHNKARNMCIKNLYSHWSRYSYL